MDADAEDETKYLEQKEEIATSVVKYRDPYTRFCSVRWRTALCIFFGFSLLYMHRVNLSLAVVCMVDTTKSNSVITHTNDSFKYSSNKSDNVDKQLIVTDLELVNGSLHNTSADEVKVVEQSTSLTDIDIKFCGSTSQERHMEWTAEIEWTKAEVSVLLSSYFYGSFFTQVPAGTLADKYGGRHIFTVTMTISGACSLVVPIIARTSLILMIIVRIVLGLAGGAVIPAGMSMVNRWSTPRERPVMIAFCGSGLLIGTIVTFLSSGLLCKYGFDNGWPSIFYLHGAVSFLFVIVWYFTAYSSPADHPRITTEEANYIQKYRSDATNRDKRKIPWIKIFTSKPMWATLVSHFCFNWSFFTVLINVPLFLKEVLKFEITSNGLFSSLPYVFQIISSISSSTLAEVIIKKNKHFHLFVRRTFNTVSLVGIAGCLVMAGYVTCEARHVAVVLLCLSCVFAGMSYGGLFANHAEYSGRLAGTTFGVSNAAGVVSSILASLMAGLLTPNGLQEEWQTVFYLAAGVDILGAVVFAICSDVHIQPWARQEIIITVEECDDKPAQEMIPLNNDITTEK